MSESFKAGEEASEEDFEGEAASRSIFLNKRVVFALPDGPLDVVVVGVREEQGFFFYECLLDNGRIYYQAMDAVCGVTIVEDLAKPRLEGL